MRRRDDQAQWVHTDEEEVLFGFTRTALADMPPSLRKELAKPSLCSSKSADYTQTACIRVADHPGVHVGLDEHNVPAVWR
jgi:hypothetical protein